MLDRRNMLRVGALTLAGGAFPLRAADTTSSPGNSSQPRDSNPRAAGTKQSAKACIFMLLQGGPSHLDLWDPKPEAPAEVRGPFQTIETSLAGVRFGDLLKHTAKVADKLTLVRSMTHRFTNHIAGTYITLTGSTDQRDQDREADAKDFPGPGAVLNYLRRTPSRIPTSVSLPNWLSIPGPSNRMPGQYAGILGSVYDPLLVAGDPQAAEFRPMSLSLPPTVSSDQLASRFELLKSLDAATRKIESNARNQQVRFRDTAYELLTDPKVRAALDLSKEPAAMRDRYGRNKLGQSLLLARRLVEAGVQFVAYNAFNQAWDHHGNIRGSLEREVPRMEQAYAALVGDLAERGLLDSTLVVNTGEFGRTPAINKDGGRDHWPDVYTTVLAGGGIRRGLVYGQSDKKGAYVKDAPVSPADLLATIWHQLGIDPHTMLRDRLGRPIPLSTGRVVRELLT